MKFIGQRDPSVDNGITGRLRKDALRTLCRTYGTVKVGRSVYAKTTETDTTPDGDVVDVAVKVSDANRQNFCPLYIITGASAYYAGAWYDVAVGTVWYDYDFVRMTGVRWDNA